MISHGSDDYREVNNGVGGSSTGHASRYLSAKKALLMRVRHEQIARGSCLFTYLAREEIYFVANCFRER